MKKKNINTIDAAMRNHTIITILIMVFMVIGAIALVKMPRNEFPQFTIRQGVVVGVYPGATSDEVEDQLTKKVENYIFSYKEVKKSKTYSYSKEGMMYIFVELNDDVKNADQFWSKFKHGLSELKMTLPSGVMALIANSDFGDTSALLITLSSDTKSYKELEFELKKLEAECRKIPTTSKIKHFGLQKEEILVKVKPELLNEYNIKSLSLLGNYQLNGMVNYAGSLKDGDSELAVHLPENFHSEEDLANQIVYSDPNGNVVRLKDIATIERQYEDPDSYIKQNGKKTILLSLEMQPGNNIVEFGKEVDKAIATFEKNTSKDIKVAKISELPKYVNESVTNFMKEFLIAIIAVILVTMLLLPLRVASVAAITVPISVLITLSVLYFLGVELHTVSLAALILVLGMIVDNSIVVIDNHVEIVDHGGFVWHAAIKSAQELFIPILTATLAIIAAYIPLGFMLPGTAGEFVETLPIVVSIALIVSIVIAVFFVPFLNFVFIKKGLKKDNPKQSKSFLDIVQQFFDKTLEWAFRYKKLVVGLGVIIIAFSVWLFKNLDQQMFPEMERNQFAVEVYLTNNSSLESTANVMDSLQNALLKDKRITNVTSFIGTSSPRFHTVYAPNMPSPNYGQLLVNTVSNEATREVVKEYGDRYADKFPNAHVKMKILAMQLFKAPIEIRISSDSIRDIRKVESDVKAILRKTENVGWTRTDWEQKQQSIKVNLDADKANRLGYSKALVSTSIMAGIDGLPLTTIWEGDYPITVKLSQDIKESKSIHTLENLYITSPYTFSAVPLRSIAKFVPEWHEGNIVHYNGTRTLTILVDNDGKGVANTIFNKIKPEIDQLKLPEGTSIVYGGDYESQKEVFTPMTIALGISIVLIFFILLFHFKKVKLVLLVMSTMLLTLPGAAIGLKVMHYPFSLTAFIGITSLIGMVVRNGIILVDYAVELRNVHKMNTLEAAIAAGKRRMRPIFLTAAAAAVGVIPMVLSRSSLWGPLGTVISFGLIFSMVLTLYILPILFTTVYKKIDKMNAPSKRKIPRLLSVVVGIFFFLGMGSQKVMAQQPISLDSCKVLTLQNNKKIKEIQFEAEQSKEVKESAFTNYFPKISANVLGMKSNDYLIKGEVPAFNLPVYDGNPANLATATEYAYFPGMKINMLDEMYMGSITAIQPLFTGGQILNGNKLANLGYEVSLQKEKLTQDENLMKTEELYWTIVSLKEKRETLKKYEQFLDGLHKDVSVAYKAGLVQKSDLLKVELKQNEIALNKLKLENGIALSQKAMCQQIGISYDVSIEFGDEANAIVVVPQSIVTANESIVENRTEYQLLSKAVSANELQKKMILGENLPQLAVGASGHYMDMGDNESKNFLGFVTLSIPISDWWSGSHKLKEQQLKVYQAQNKLDETKELLSLQINQAENELRETYFQVQNTQKSIEQATENLKITEDNYHAGLNSMSDLLEAQALYQNTLNDYSDAKNLYQVKIAKYLMAIGKYK